MIRLVIVLLLFIASLTGCQPKNKTSQPKEEKTVPKKKLELDYSFHFVKDSLEQIDIGTLLLPTGKIIAGDPFFMHDMPPFSKTVAPGSYPVKIIISKIEEDHYRVAFAKISFTSSQAVRWEMALTGNITRGAIDSLKEDEYFGYPVDAGLGCFTDAETNKLFTETVEEFDRKNPKGNYYDDVLAAEFKKASGDHPLSTKLGNWCNHFLKGDKHNILIFSSGWGDGYYPSYWGYDSKDQIVELITDFLVLEPAKK